MKSLQELIAIGRDKGASDLHLEAGSPSVFRIHGELSLLGEPWSSDALSQLAKQVLGQQWFDLQERKSTDLSKTIAGTRCRINCFFTLRGISFSIRLLSSFRNNIRDCNLHPDLKKLVDVDTGLVIVSGPTGSGKSTTLAALIEEINTTQRKNIITLESPVEYYFHNRQSFIRQREIPNHSPSFEQAITDSMREDPDVLVIGEMRSPDVMRLTLNAAETGHLVLATLHSSTCAEAVSRLAMSFAPELQGAIRSQIADCLVAVVCQRLTYHPQLKILLPTLEIMMASSSVKASIRAGSMSQLANAIQTGAEDGMWSFDRYKRWMDSKKDWVKPSEAAPIPIEDVRGVSQAELPIGETRVTRANYTSSATAHASSHSSASQTNAGGNAQASAKSKFNLTPTEPGPASGRIEISVDDMDLEALAKQIATRESED